MQKADPVSIETQKMNQKKYLEQNPYLGTFYIYTSIEYVCCFIKHLADSLLFFRQQLIAVSY
jgi:hypothetical protein